MIVYYFPPPGYLFFFLSCLSFVHSAQEAAGRELVDRLETQIRADFEFHSRIELIDKVGEFSQLFTVFFHQGLTEHVRGRLRTREGNVDEETTNSVVEKLVDFFGRKVAALQRIVGAAEQSTRDFDVDAPLIEEEADCFAHQQEMNATDLRNLPPNPTVRSGVHVALETFRCDLNVVRDFRWTKGVERQFGDNGEKDGDLLRQYVATHSGLSRVHPRELSCPFPSILLLLAAFRWASEPVSVDLFDSRHRAWFVNAETGPKDIVFLLD